MAQKLPLELPEAKPSVKAEKVDCTGCHDLSKRQSLENLEEGCTQCHDKAYKELAKGLRDEILEAQKKTKGLIDQTSQVLLQAKRAKRETGQAPRLLEQSRKSYDFVVKARGIHNLDLANQILEQSQKDVQRAEEILRVPRSTGGK